MRFPALVLLPLALAACGGEPAEQPADPAPNAVATSVGAIPAVMRSTSAAALGAAFTAAFADPNVRIGDDLYRFRPAALYRLPDKWVLLSEGSGPDCSACAGRLAVHYLARTADGFAVREAWPDAIPGSGYGAPPEWQLRTDLTGAPVIQSEASGMGQGIVCRVARLTALTPEGPAPIAERIPLDYSNAGAIVDGSAATEVQGAIVAGDSDEGFTVRYSGTVDRAVPYQRSDDGYAPAASAADIPQC